MEQKTELKTCPFCGSSARIQEAINRTGRYHVVCNNLTCKCPMIAGIPLWENSKEAAALDWNTRPEEEPRVLSLEELRTMGGLPVFVVYNNDGDGMWRVFHQTDNNFGAESGSGKYAQFEDGTSLEAWKYGDTWLAYTSKPKEGTEI